MIRLSYFAELTSSDVLMIFSTLPRDGADVLPDNTNLYSRLYALKKILPQEDANMLATELERLISRAKIDVYKMNILPADWKDLYDRILFL